MGFGNMKRDIFSYMSPAQLQCGILGPSLGSCYLDGEDWKSCTALHKCGAPLGENFTYEVSRVWKTIQTIVELSSYVRLGFYKSVQFLVKSGSRIRRGVEERPLKSSLPGCIKL